jgi:hypothetical protein
MRQFCNFLLAVILGISVYLILFDGFAAPEIPTLGDALLRFLAALCLQLLTLRTGRKEIVRFGPMVLTFFMAVWGFFLFLTSPSWQGTVLSAALADYLTPVCGCVTGWLIHRKLYP